ncbi:ABC-2 family transporter protein [Candidatus Gottesmanbacteria bacterium]|nr:ABC-2 family transporter protein [Candidatus Gottesmanbacteria bacterium]
MKYIKIFLLHLQDALENRSRSVVWFLISFINPFIYLLFWRGAAGSVAKSGAQWTVSGFASYYVLLVIASSFLMVHIEEYIAWYDIKEGYLANHLLRPVSYFWNNFFHELPYRMLQGSFGLVVFLVFLFVYPGLIKLVHNPTQIFFGIVIIVFAYFLSFSFKMFLGLSALFTTDFFGLSELVNVLILIFGGFVIPLDLFPSQMKQFLSFLPFPYMFYYPIIAIQGRMETAELMRVIVIQMSWILVLFLVYRYVWQKGVRLFTGVGR